MPCVFSLKGLDISDSEVLDSEIFYNCIVWAGFYMAFQKYNKSCSYVFLMEDLSSLSNYCVFTCDLLLFMH